MQGGAPQTQAFRSCLYLDQWLLITQEDLPPLGDGGGSVEVDQLVEGVELLLPQEVLPRGLSKHFEVLHLVAITRGKIQYLRPAPTFGARPCSGGDLESEGGRETGSHPGSRIWDSGYGC